MQSVIFFVRCLWIDLMEPLLCLHPWRMNLFELPGDITLPFREAPRDLGSDSSFKPRNSEKRQAYVVLVTAVLQGGSCMECNGQQARDPSWCEEVWGYPRKLAMIRESGTPPWACWGLWETGEAKQMEKHRNRVKCFMWNRFGKCQLPHKYYFTVAIFMVFL